MATRRTETLRRLGWFVALWAGGIMALGAVGMLIKLALPA